MINSSIDPMGTQLCDNPSTLLVNKCDHSSFYPCNNLAIKDFLYDFLLPLLFYFLFSIY